MTFVLATHNAHKVAEFTAIIATALPDFALAGYDGPEPVESGVTFEENAYIKARAAVAHTGGPAIADDSGLCVDVLSGMPGIFSSRWSGAEATDSRNVALLLDQLTDVPDALRTAQFCCVIAVVIPATDGTLTEFSVQGVWPGRIAREPRGTGGFGYDPIFIPDGWDASAAEIDPDVKNANSHRGRAIRALATELAQRL